jgi:predicted amino acid racemase
MRYKSYCVCIEIWHSEGEQEYVVHSKEVYYKTEERLENNEKVRKDVRIGRRHVPINVLVEFDKYFSLCKWAYCNSLD